MWHRPSENQGVESFGMGRSANHTIPYMVEPGVHSRLGTRRRLSQRAGLERESMGYLRGFTMDTPLLWSKIWWLASSRTSTRFPNLSP